MSRPTAYSHPVSECPIDLDLSKNEGQPPSVSLLSNISNESSLVSRYPETSALRESIRELYGVETDQVLVTAGADDALFRCFLAHMGPGRNAVATYPSFVMIPRYADQVGGRLVEVPWWQGAFPVEAVIDAISDDTDLVFVVSPNNPTGGVIDEAALGELAARARLLVLDAVYEDFAEHGLTRAALEMENVVIIRTLSKAWGLAGLRVGYVLGSTELVTELAAYGNPYSVSGLSASLAIARLNDRDEVAEFIGNVRSQRDTLAGILDSHGIITLPSQANFLLARFDAAEWVLSVAASLGVALRRFPDRPGLGDYLRITLPGDQPRFERLVHTLLSAVAPEALLFDLDGVLADVADSRVTAVVETAASVGVDGLGGLEPREEALVDSTMLERWAEMLPIGVVTGRPKSDAEEFLARFGMLDSISALVTREDARSKPDSAPIRLALERLGVDRAWMVGGTPDDVAAARGAGVVPIGVVAPGDDPNRSRRSLGGTARILGSVSELEGLLS
ncbi:histidinol-phosphate aminotransferase [bacterium BMS3Abin02]|nr:histidinol-phosphate aminotransferase [bacterium BMS3Abin02]HDK45957.1 aminotransferase class I/II-fold pyridoxal phosphate-dependent enzyme [Actinomycetota bacterium]HDL49617.1 aminotransferase class I/II-fold pyridoxal phosphate-dependent enzyme [Actinomycetota bacterium]